MASESNSSRLDFIMFSSLITIPIRRGYLPRMLEEDAMVDAFAEFHPDARNRASCWSPPPLAISCITPSSAWRCQYTNDRYINGGRRIDYTMVDRDFFAEFALKGELPLDTGGADLDPNSPEAALAACTLNGSYKMAAFEGGGMVDMRTDQYNAQFRAPCTGLVYTPPKLSDHIAVTLLLRSGAVTPADSAHMKRCPDTGKFKYDAETRKCQPHVSSSKPLTSFFKPNGATPRSLNSYRVCL
jgi:hypothetical protein